jgi:hypothetical protein
MHNDRSEAEMSREDSPMTVHGLVHLGLKGDKL